MLPKRLDLALVGLCLLLTPCLLATSLEPGYDVNDPELKPDRRTSTPKTSAIPLPGPDDLALQLECTKQTYYFGEPPVVRLSVENVTEHTVRKITAMYNTFWYSVATEGADFTDLTRGTEPQRRDRQSPSPLMRPGQVYRRADLLGWPWRGFEIGHYRVRVRLIIPLGRKPPMEFFSNEVTFQVVPPPGRNDVLLEYISPEVFRTQLAGFLWRRHFRGAASGPTPISEESRIVGDWREVLPMVLNDQRKSVYGEVLHYAWIRMRKGTVEQQEQWVERFLKEYPGSALRPMVLASLIKTYDSRGRHEDALRSAEEAVALYPDEAVFRGGWFDMDRKRQQWKRLIRQRQEREAQEAP